MGKNDRLTTRKGHKGRVPAFVLPLTCISTCAMEDSALHPRRNDPQAARNQPNTRILIDTGVRLASASSLDMIAARTLDAGLHLSRASLGVCFYMGAEAQAGKLPQYNSLGLRSSGTAFSAPPQRAPALLTALRSQSGVHSEYSSEAQYLQEAALAGLFPANEPLESYLAIAIHDHGGEQLGAVVYGHPDAGFFGSEAQSLVTALAIQAGLAVDHLLLQQRLAREVARADQAEGKQRDTSRRLQQVLQAAQLGTWRWDASTGLIDFDNRAAELFGVPPGVPISRNKLREHIVHPEDLHRSPDDLRSILASGGQYSAEYRVRNAAGEDRWIAANGSPSAEPGQGRFAGMIGTLQDITSRKTQEESLRTSEKLAATGRLAATIAHEINNPLEAVTNLIYLAKTDPITPPAVSRMLETADTELARVSQIAQQTLGFYRDTSRPVSVDLNDLLQAVVDLFDRKLTGKRLHCTLDLEPGLNVFGLQGEIRQVVSNLLVNAIDASESNGGKIHIRARRRHRDGGRGVSMLISDQGSGIPHHVRHRLFTPFTTTKQSLGTGLGLWVTQGMVEKHGGSVRFRSRTETPSGTVFRVYLPESGSPRLFAHQSSPVLQ